MDTRLRDPGAAWRYAMLLVELAPGLCPCRVANLLLNRGFIRWEDPVLETDTVVWGPNTLPPNPPNPDCFAVWLNDGTVLMYDLTVLPIQ